MQQEVVDDQIVEMLNFLSTVELPFASADIYEYWLLDAAEEKPLALIFSCTEASQMDKFPARAEWTALPAAVMPVAKTEKEEKDQTPPVNYRLELLVSERAGSHRKAAWFNRNEQHSVEFPSYNDSRRLAAGVRSGALSALPRATGTTIADVTRTDCYQSGTT